MTEPQQMRDAAGADFLVPPRMPDGETAPPMPVQCQVGLSDPDVKGRRWEMLMLSDDTITVQIRMPWQVAARFGAAIGQQLAAMGQRAQMEAGPQLLRPGVDFPRGPVPPPPPNGGGNRG